MYHLTVLILLMFYHDHLLADHCIYSIIVYGSKGSSRPVGRHQIISSYKQFLDEDTALFVVYKSIYREIFEREDVLVKLASNIPSLINTDDDDDYMDHDAIVFHKKSQVTIRIINNKEQQMILHSQVWGAVMLSIDNNNSSLWELSDSIPPCPLNVLQDILQIKEGFRLMIFNTRNLFEAQVLTLKTDTLHPSIESIARKNGAFCIIIVSPPKLQQNSNGNDYTYVIYFSSPLSIIDSDNKDIVKSFEALGGRDIRTRKVEEYEQGNPFYYFYKNRVYIFNFNLLNIDIGETIKIFRKTFNSNHSHLIFTMTIRNEKAMDLLNEHLIYHSFLVKSPIVFVAITRTSTQTCKCVCKLDRNDPLAIRVIPSLRHIESLISGYNSDTDSSPYETNFELVFASSSAYSDLLTSNLSLVKRFLEAAFDKMAQKNAVTEKSHLRFKIEQKLKNQEKDSSNLESHNLVMSLDLFREVFERIVFLFHTSQAINNENTKINMNGLCISSNPSLVHFFITFDRNLLQEIKGFEQTISLLLADTVRKSSNHHDLVKVNNPLKNSLIFMIHSPELGHVIKFTSWDGIKQSMLDMNLPMHILEIYRDVDHNKEKSERSNSKCKLIYLPYKDHHQMAFLQQLLISLILKYKPIQQVLNGKGGFIISVLDKGLKGSLDNGRVTYPLVIRAIFEDIKKSLPNDYHNSIDTFDDQKRINLILKDEDNTNRSPLLWNTNGKLKILNWSLIEKFKDHSLSIPFVLAAERKIYFLTRKNYPQNSVLLTITFDFDEKCTKKMIKPFIKEIYSNCKDDNNDNDNDLIRVVINDKISPFFIILQTTSHRYFLNDSFKSLEGENIKAMTSIRVYTHKDLVLVDNLKFFKNLQLIIKSNSII